MARRVFYSFHYKPDNWGTAQVRNIGSIDGNRPTTDNDWETIKQSGDSAIKQVDCQPDEEPFLHSRPGWDEHR